MVGYDRLHVIVRPKASVSIIVGCSTETTSGSTRPPVIETERLPMPSYVEDITARF